MNRRNATALGVVLLVMAVMALAGCTKPPQNVQQGNVTGDNQSLTNVPGTGNMTGSTALNATGNKTVNATPQTGGNPTAVKGSAWGDLAGGVKL